MAGSMKSETPSAASLNVSREPVGPSNESKGDKTDGDRAVMDAVLIVLAAWLVLFMLTGSLRRFNI